RYRDEAVARSWAEHDPVLRLRRTLERAALWDESREDGLIEELTAELGEAVRRADAAPEPAPEEIVEHVFAELGGDQLAAWEALRDRWGGHARPRPGAGGQRGARPGARGRPGRAALRAGRGPHGGRIPRQRRPAGQARRGARVRHAARRVRHRRLRDRHGAG